MSEIPNMLRIETYRSICKKQSLQEVLDDIMQLRAEIRDEVLKVETDIKNGGSKDFLTAVHKKKTYQSMGLTFAAEIIQKRIDAL